MDMQLGIVSSLSFALAHSLWQLTLLGGLAALCLAMLKHCSAALRHVVGMAWLLAMLCAPVLTFASYWRQAALIADGRAPQAAPDLQVIVHSLTPWADDGLAWVTPLWLMGVIVMVVLNIGGGWRMLRRLERAPYRALPAEWQRRVDAMSVALGITRTVAVRLAASVGTPFTARMLRPVIWLPEALLSQLPLEQIKVLLAHELAHIRRLDWLWNGIQCVIESLLFFHPAVWWLSARIRQDREHACDDLAVAVCGDGIALAEALATLARHGLTTPPLVLAAQGGPLMKRISHILSQPSKRTSWRAPAFLLLALSSGMLFAMQAEPLKVPANPHSAASQRTSKGHSQIELSTTSPAGKQLHYQSTTVNGRVTESYTEDGEARPIDSEVRNWVRQMETAGSAPLPPVPPLPALAAPPAPPPLPAMAALAAPPAPPAPPTPPARPARAGKAAPPAPPAPPALPAVAAPPAPPALPAADAA